MTEPGPDHWTVDRVERVRVSHPPTGKSAEAATEDEAFGRLTRELVRDGDITIGGPLRPPPAVASKPLPMPFLMTPEAEYRFTAAAVEWAEVFPGLEVRMARAIFACSPDGAPAAVELEFRHVPQAVNPFADKAARRGG